jgi:hypothetical protein
MPEPSSRKVRISVSPHAVRELQKFDGTSEDGANYAAARVRMTYEVVSSVWGVTSTWTIKARSLLEAHSKASEELSERSYAGYIVSVRQLDAS